MTVAGSGLPAEPGHAAPGERDFFSPHYGDIYFDAGAPESEKHYVFIDANRLKERIPTIEQFVVAELGFGFGLNCALAIAAAEASGNAHRLAFYSVEEKFPEPRDVQLLLQRLTSVAGIYEEIWAKRSDLVRGDAIEVRGARISVFSGNADDFVATAKFRADCWFFDGFSPAKNPAMWSESLLGTAYTLAKPGATFSTYTAAGWVRRNLQAAGFYVEKVKGFRGKREMLRGEKHV